MRVSYNWLKDLVKIDISPEKLSHALTMVGLEVEGEEKLGEEINNVVIGYVKKVESHPNADKLSVCLVDVGKEEDFQIICGASNVREGQKVPVALPGAKLPGGMKIKKAKIRGVESRGMICSAQELGIDDVLIPESIKNGIWVLDDGAPVGGDFKEYSSLNDIVFEIGLTPNRADCLSMINVAREVKAITGAGLQLPKVEFTETDTPISEKATVEIEAPDLCARYSARLIENVKIGPSPDWLQARLRSYGIRSINNVVDITNYVMLETGQPLHAFDYDLLAEHRIIVRRARENEKITTLDGVERTLTSDMLVIADGEKPVAIAGIMGGYDTEVTGKTTNILLESAHFNPANIRHSSRKLGLRSEASNRFEKGVDRAGTVDAANRAAQLLEMLADGKVAKGVLDEYHDPVKPGTLELRIKRANDILGTNLNEEYIIELLERLSFAVEKVKDEILKVEIPTYRQDITREIDLVEEIARLHGYDKIETTLPEGAAERVIRPAKQVVQDKVRNVLAATGLAEVITYSFISPNAYEKLTLESDNVLRNSIEISNPLSEEQSVMRTTIVPGLLQTAARNNNRRINDLAIFEIGRVFHPSADKLPQENTIAAGLVMGEDKIGWQWKKVPRDFFYCKGILENLLQNLNLEASYEPLTDREYLHPGRAARVKVDDKTVGYLGEVHPRVIENFDLVDRACVFEVNLDLIANLYGENRMYQPLPKYPGVTRDMAIVIKEEIPAAKVEELIERYGKPLISQVRLFDVYRGKQVPEGYKSLAYSLYYQAEDRTLTDEEVAAIHEDIQKELEKQLGAKLR
ncbi:MAG: phenylalanyl-tRNA synthetase beta chain [Clostridia bacterium]|nr:phenylalanyl-tRNA synthetase beta chain [Clostridia bacterium]